MTDASTPEALIEVSGVSRVFTRRGTQTRAVDGASFRMLPERDLGVVGESGSGKTTLARIIMGLESVTTGTVRVLGRDVTKSATTRRARRDRARLMQMVFQDPYGSLDPRATVRECLDEVLRLHPPGNGMTRLNRIAQLCDLVGLSAAQRERTPRELSGGQCQRVAIARAIAVEPRIIILDEAVAALDISIQAQILNLLADLRAELGTAYLLISHDLAVVRQLTDDVVVMHRGRVVESGATDRVLRDPRDPYTQRLKASIPSPAWRQPGALERLSSSE